MPQLSVIVPVYNTCEYIHRCINSLMKQSYNDYEIILVDDGSTDGSGSICDEYSELASNIKAIHQDNQGLVKARLQGVRYSEGEFIAFVDSDDWQERDAFLNLMKPLYCENYKDLDIIAGGYVVESGNNDVVNHFVKEDKCIMSSQQAFIKMLEGNTYNWSMVGKIYRKTLWDKVDMSHAYGSSYGEDTFANWKLFDVANNILYIPVYKYHYCMRETSMMHQSFSDNQLVYFDIINDMFLEKKKENNQLLNTTIAKFFTKVTLDKMILMADRYYLYKKEFIRYLQMMDNLLAEAKYIPTKQELRKIKLLHMPNDAYKKIREKRQIDLYKSLSDFQNVHEKKYIYGAGGIAREIACIMEDKKIHFESFVITEYSKCSLKKYNKAKIHNYDIVTFESLNKRECYNAGFVLGLNEINTAEVYKFLLSKGVDEKNILNAGRFLLEY